MKAAWLLLGLVCMTFGADRSEYFSTSSGPIHMTPILHSSMVLEGAGQVIYVDPISAGNYKGIAKADVILITQDDPAHFDPAVFAHISRKSTAIIGPAGPVTKLPQSTAVASGESLQVGGVVIEATAAYFPDAAPAAGAAAPGKHNGYILTFPGSRIYISGDTGFIPEMKKIKGIDVALVAMDSPGSMTLADAGNAARVLKAGILYPYNFPPKDAPEIRKQLIVPGTEVRLRDWE